MHKLRKGPFIYEKLYERRKKIQSKPRAKYSRALGVKELAVTRHIRKVRCSIE